MRPPSFRHALVQNLVQGNTAVLNPAAAALVQARSGGQALLATVAAHLLLHGNAYVQVMRAADGSVAELFALRPERVSVEADAGGCAFIHSCLWTFFAAW